MGTRSSVYMLAILGLLTDGPMHGYELRKRLNVLLGTLRAFSYGSLYPCLRDLLAQGLIEEAGPADAGAPALSGKRAKIVYRITAEGKEHFAQLLGNAGPSSWEDAEFGVHFAFFRHLDSDVRLRILEGRRSRLEERREGVRSQLARTRERLDRYTQEMQRYGLESAEREVRWISELIHDERSGNKPRHAPHN